MQTLFIKNMVCDRCIMAVNQALKRNGITPSEVTLGKVIIDGDISENQKNNFKVDLERLGFELL